jgi:hypothetical protein
MRTELTSEHCLKHTPLHLLLVYKNDWGLVEVHTFFGAVTELMGMCGVGRRVAWDAPLGFQRAKLTFASLHGGLLGGGPLPCTLLLIQRCYPVVYWVKLGGSALMMTATALAAAEGRYNSAAARVSPLHPCYHARAAIRGSHRPSQQDMIMKGLD